MKHHAHISLVGAVVILSLIITGCAGNTAKGGGIGAAIGGAIGAIVGKQYDNTVEGALAGAAVGGTAGALIGRYMDQQAEEMRNQVEGVEVQRVGEGIKLVFDSGILFEFDSADLQPTARDNVQKLAQILEKYQRTNIVIEGHTDSVGDEGYNMRLSENRARSVADHLVRQGVASGRFSTTGFGETEPVATNDTEAGRQQNRRVEIAVVATEELREAAENGSL